MSESEFIISDNLETLMHIQTGNVWHTKQYNLVEEIVTGWEIRLLTAGLAEMTTKDFAKDLTKRAKQELESILKTKGYQVDKRSEFD